MSVTSSTSAEPDGSADASERPTRVLFIHGLESGPEGTKTRALRQAGFDVVAVQMPCGQSAMARDPFTLALVGGGLAAVLLAGFLAGGLGAGVVGLALASLRPRGTEAIVRRAFRRSLQVQEAALADGIDVVVGSSFGGAVALQLVRDGQWRGPTVLLCPAWQLVAHRSGEPPPPTLSELGINTDEILVVHGTNDEVVPLRHSRELVSGTSAQLLEVEDDHRLTTSTTAANLRAWIERIR